METPRSSSDFIELILVQRLTIKRLNKRINYTFADSHQESWSDGFDTQASYSWRMSAEGEKIKIRQFNFEMTINGLICKGNGLS